MRTRLFWIPIPDARLAIAAAPRGADYLSEELQSLRAQGIEHLVSLLTPSEQQERELLLEAAECESRGLRFTSLPMEDRGVPDADVDFDKVIRLLAEQVRAGMGMVVHCRAGIGRSAVVAACLASYLGVLPETAFRMIGAARGCAVPDTAEQREWVESHYGSRSGRARK